MTPSADDIQAFLKAQVAAWNAGDKDRFMGLYRDASPNGLDIDYVGEPRRDPWEVLETMWENQADKVQVEVMKTIINDSEAACLHRNHIQAGGGAIDTIEIYAFRDGRLSVRYFIETVPADG